MKGNGRAAYLMYRRGRSLRIGGGVRVLAEMQDSYFNRSFRHFCSHFYTPNDPDSHRPGCVLSADGRVGCIAWYVFDEYRANGAYHQKQIVCDMLDALLGDAKTLETDLPSNGVTTLLYQEAEHRYVQHLLYAVTKQRGRAEVIEDAIPLRDVAVTLRLPCGVTPRRVMLVPDCTALPLPARTAASATPSRNSPCTAWWQSRCDGGETGKRGSERRGTLERVPHPPELFPTLFQADANAARGGSPRHSFCNECRM